MKTFSTWRALGVFMLIVGWWHSSGAQIVSNVYSTQFEVAQGYNANLDLAGQQGWVAEGTGGNGLLTDVITGQGQHAYVGYTPPIGTNEDQLIVYQPINFNPVTAQLPIVKFTTQLQIIDSSTNNAQYDNFRWSVYNTLGNRLFSIDFDNYFFQVNYILDGTNQLTDAKLLFTNGVTYTLAVTMNFASNRWSATLNSAVIATNLPMTTTGAPLTLGDVDAVWLIYLAATPGDNFMVFDNYQITAEALTVPPVPPAQVAFLGRTTEGWGLLRVTGQNGSRWALDATTNFTSWVALRTNTISSGSFDHVDNTAVGQARRFYRARLVP